MMSISRLAALLVLSGAFFFASAQTNISGKVIYAWHTNPNGIGCQRDTMALYNGLLFTCQTGLYTQVASGTPSLGDLVALGLAPFCTGSTPAANAVLVYLSGCIQDSGWVIDSNGISCSTCTGASTFQVTMGSTPGAPGAVGQAVFQVNSTSGGLEVVPHTGAASYSVQAKTAGAHKWFSALGTDGVLVDTQPSFADMSDSVGSSQLPFPGASAKGAILSTTCSAGNHVYGYNTDGTPNCTADAGGSSGMQLPNTRRWAYWAPPGSGTISAIGDVEAEVTPGGTAATLAVSSTEPELREVMAAASVSSLALINGNGIWWLPRSPRIQTYVQLPAAGDYSGVRVYITMQDGTSAATQFAGDSPATLHFGFRATAGTDTNWQCQHRNASAVDVADSGVAVNTTGHNFEAYYTYGTGIAYYIDGAAVCTGISQTHVPGSSANNSWRYVIGTMSTDTAAVKHIGIGWVYVSASK